MANSVLMGMAVSSNTTAQTATATIDHLDAMTNVPQRSSNLVAWYRADVGVTQSSGSVSQWSDQSGNSNNVTQSTGGLQPSFVSNTLNGQPVLHFTHANNSYLSLANNTTLDPSQITIFTVARNTGSSAGMLVDKLTGSTGYSLRLSASTTPALYINATNKTGTLSANTWALLEGKYDQTNLSLYVNGTLNQTALTTAISTSAQPLSIGGLSTTGNTPDSDVAEVLIFNSALSDIDRHNVEAYLYQKYGVGTQPVSPVPNISANGGIYNTTLGVTLNAGQTGETIYYTTDGSTPTTSSTVYTTPIVVSSTETIKAIAVVNGYASSSVASASYTIDTTANFTHTGLVAWLRADVGVTQSGGTVSQWNDLSGNGNNATQSTGTKQPALVSSALNGQPILRFNAANNTYLAIPNNSTLNGTKMTLIIVAKKTSSTSQAILIGKDQAPPYSYFWELNNSNSSVCYINGAFTVNGTLAASTYGEMEAVYDQVSARMYINGTQTQSTAYTTALVTTNTDPVSIGGESLGSSLDGDIAEVLIYNTGLTDVQRHQVEAYLYARYGVGVQPAAPSTTLSVSGGVYAGTQTVILTPGQAGDTIYYTTDGSTPTSSSNVYSNPLTISSTTTLKVIEEATGYANSSIVSATYTIDTTANFTRTGLVAWLRADVGVTQSGGTVSQWNDQSGNGNNATQSTGTKQPAFVSSVLNGQPILRFNATNNTYLAIPNNSTLNGTKLAMFAVVKKTSSTTQAMVIAKSLSGSYPYRLALLGASTPTLYLNSNALSQSGTLTNSTYGLLETNYDQVNARLYVNGTQAQSTAYTTALLTTNTDPVTIGGGSDGYSLDGDIAEVLIYNTGVTDSQRQEIEAYLYNKYGVGTPPPAAPPTFSVPQGIYSGTQTIALTAGHAGDTLYYTTDGSTPTTSSSVYSTQLIISGTTTLKVLETATGYAGTVRSATYTIDSTFSFTRTNLLTWYRADAGVTQSSGAVSQWIDQSGNGYNLTQSNSALQPSLVSNTLNGKPVVHFTHASNSFMSVANSTALNPTQITIFTVARNTGSGTGAYILVDKFALADGGSGTGYSQRLSSITTLAFYINGTTNVLGTLSANTWAVTEDKYDQSQISLYINGTLTQTTKTGAIASNTQPLSIGGLAGGGATPDADIAEMLIFNSALSDSDRHNVEAYLYARYAVGVQPTAPSPTLSISTGVYSGTQTVTINPGQAGQTLYYTTDGSTPTTSSSVYNMPLTFSSTTTLKVSAAAPGFVTSSVVSATYAIDTTANFTRTGLIAWYRADMGVTQSSGSVSQWNDISGNGNNVTQGVSGNKPTVTSNAFNGKPVISFNGSSQYLSAPTSTSLKPSNITMIAVYDVKSTSGVPRIIAQNYSSSGWTHPYMAWALGAQTNSSKFQAETDITLLNSGVATMDVYFTGYNTTINTPYILEATYDGTNYKNYLNGMAGISVQYGGPIQYGTGNIFDIGTDNNNERLNGDIAEILVFNTALSDQDRHNVEAYLYARYNTGVQPTAPAPTFGPNGGIFNQPQSVTLSAGQAGETIYYTTDGSTPTISSTVYTAPIAVSSTETIKAITVLNGYVNSDVVTASYTMDVTTSFTRGGLLAWYRADTGVTQSSGLVSQWNDQSGNGNNVTQATGANQPVLTSNVINGKPALRFNGSTQTLVGSTGAGFKPTNITVLAVYDMRGTGNAPKIIAQNYYSSGTWSSPYLSWCLGEHLLSSQMQAEADVTALSGGVATLSGNFGSVATSLNTPYVLENIYNGSTQKSFLNGQLFATSSPSGAIQYGSATGFNIGSDYNSESLNGDIAEILVFNTALSDQDHLAVEYYLSQRYGILISPTLANPQFSVSSGTLSAPQAIAITAPAGSTIYYTTDGSTPTTSSQVYTGPIYVNYSETLKAIAYENGYPTTSVISAAYTLNPTLWPAPTTGNPTPPTINLQLPTNATLLP